MLVCFSTELSASACGHNCISPEGEPFDPQQDSVTTRNASVQLHRVHHLQLAQDCLHRLSRAHRQQDGVYNGGCTAVTSDPTD